MRGSRRRGRPGLVRPAAGRLGEVVAPPALVVDHADDAGGAGAERVLRGGVGVAARAQGVDVPDRFVRRARDLVERPAVTGVQRAGGAVRGHAGRPARGVDVARPLRGRLRHAARRGGTGQCADQDGEGGPGSGEATQRTASVDPPHRPSVVTHGVSCSSFSATREHVSVNNSGQCPFSRLPSRLLTNPAAPAPGRRRRAGVASTPPVRQPAGGPRASDHTHGLDSAITADRLTPSAVTRS